MQLDPAAMLPPCFSEAMRHTAAEFSSRPTLNHNTPKPLIPPPPALPRFELPLDGIFDSADDPLDVAVTTQRPTLDAARALRILRPGPRIPPQVDATSEVQVEDILLEVYAEERPPPTRRSSGPLSTAGAAPLLPAHVSIANAIVSALPASAGGGMHAPADSAAVDALLRASDPAFLPLGGYVAQRPVTPFGGFAATPPPVAAAAVPTPYSAYAYGAPVEHYSPDQESPSVAPVAFPSAHMPVASHGPAPQQYHAAQVAPSARAEKRAGRGAAIAIWSIVLVAVGLGSGLGVTVGIRNGTFAELRDRAKALTSQGESPTAAAAATAPIAPPASQPSQPSQPSQAVVAPALTIAPPSAPTPSVTPTISVNALPAQVIAPSSALVTFPPSAQGHRVFFDGRPMAVTREPMTLRCGRHMIRIGSSGKARVTDLACGVPVTLR